MIFSASWFGLLALLLLHACCSAERGAHSRHTSQKHDAANKRSYPSSHTNGASNTHNTNKNNNNNVLIINIIGDTPDQLEGALNSALSYINLSGICRNSIHCRAFMPSLQESSMTSDQRNQMQQLRSFIDGDIHIYPLPLISRNVGSSSDDTPEHVSEILFALSTIEQEFRTSTDNPVALSLSFSSLSSPVFDDLNNFQNIFRKVSHTMSSNEKQILLLEKNQQLTCPSDWHDLQVVVMVLASPHSQHWLEMLRKVYLHHANRSAFTLREPRAAIMESMYAEETSPHVGFLDAADVCLLPGREVPKAVLTKRVYASPLCASSSSKRTASVPLLCSCSPPTPPSPSAQTVTTPKPNPFKQSYTCPCSNIHPPSDWTTGLNPASSLLNERVRRKVPEFLKKLPDVMHFGAARFRFTDATDMPQGFCWDTGDKEYERQSQSRIYRNASVSIPYKHPVRPVSSRPTAQIVIISASGAGALDFNLHMSLSRKYYAHRHGYGYQHLVSNAYANYFGDNFLDKIPFIGEAYQKNVMSKVPMILSAMYAHMDKEWVMWMDDDTWFNPGWMQMSLDAFLEDVPSSKLVVLGNHRSAQSNVLFIRNSVAGRQLGRDWLATAASGYVQCHGFDQAALELLIMSRLLMNETRTAPADRGGDGNDHNDHNGHDDDNNIHEPAPFNFTCLQESWVREGGLSKDLYSQILGAGKPLDTKYSWGCDGGADWSCDFKFETVLRNVGFIGVSSGFHKPLSSFTQGCANDFFPDFHITSETASRPRLHVGFCSRLDEIQGTEFGYDGPLGGGNDYVRRFAVNGWMINHKAEINFYEAYREKSACRKSDTFVPGCDEHLVASMINEKKQKTDRLISLADGYAYDVEAKEYCSGGASLLDFQKKVTYMKFYSKVIQAAKNFSDADWNSKQQTRVLGEYEEIGHFKKYFHPPHYCETWCSKVFSQTRGGDVLSCKKPSPVSLHDKKKKKIRQEDGATAALAGMA